MSQAKEAANSADGIRLALAIIGITTAAMIIWILAATNGS